MGDIESILAALGGNGFPASPFSSTAASPPSKSDVYSNDELLSLFNIHQELQTMQEQEDDYNSDQGFVPFADDTTTTTAAATKMEEEEEGEESSILSLHEAVLQAMQLQQPEEEEESVAAVEAPPPQEEEEQQDNNTSWLDKDTKQRIANIRAVACDVDGTLVMSSSSSSSSLHPRTRVAVAECIRRSQDPHDPFVCFFPATGKSRTGALNSLDSFTREALQNMPGVFLQGLYCVDSQNNVVFEQTLPTATVRAAQDFYQEMLPESESLLLSMVAYRGDKLYTTQMTPLIQDLHQRYKEPLAQTVDDLTQLGEEEKGEDNDGVRGGGGGGVIHKILFLHENPEWLKTVVRPLLEKLAAETDCCVTQAIPTMLELLPPHGSKARGVAELCNRLLFATEDAYSVSQNLLAIGDAENDVGMLQQASIGVAVGNASPPAQEAADFVMTETNNEGGAGAALQVFLFET